MSIYKEAAKHKLRFETIIGNLSIEQLYTLPVDHVSKPSLKQIAINLFEQLQKTQSTGLEFLAETSATDPVLQLKFDIVKDVIETKNAEAAQATASKAQASELKELQNILQEKKGEATKQLGIKELEEKIAALKALS